MKLSIASVEDVTGYPCGNDASARCCDCDARVCDAQAETCEYCGAVFCSTSLAYHTSAYHQKKPAAEYPRLRKSAYDPLGVLVLSQEAVVPLTIIHARAIGLMTMIDSGRKDHKIIAIATEDPEYNSYREASDMPPHRMLMLRRFFQDYKQLEGKSVEVDEIREARSAHPVIENALDVYCEARHRGLAK